MIDVNIPIYRAQSVLDRAGVDKDVQDFYNVKELRHYLAVKISEEKYYDIYFSFYSLFIYYLECSVYCAAYHHLVKLGDKKAEQKAEILMKEFQNGLVKEYKVKPKNSLQTTTIHCIETC